MKYQAIRGMNDIVPPEVFSFQALEERTRCFLNLRNYNELRTPLVEYTDLFTRSIGEGTDIVNKEMYTFQDRKDRSLSLRPEMTASVVRAVLENGLLNPDEISRFYYLGPMFRAERPQAGRRRQFHQVGVEAFSKPSVYVDAEVIILMFDYLKTIGISEKHFEIKVNSIGTKEGRKQFNTKLKEYLRDHKSKLGEDDKKRLETNVLRVLDSKDKATQKICEKAPNILDHLDSESKETHEALLEILKTSKVPVTVDPKLVRGLDYYQQTVFEVSSSVLGAQDAVGAGGRYDSLVKDFGGPDIGGIGFAFGIERLLLTLNEISKDKKEEDGSLVFLAHSDSEGSKNYCLELSRKLTEKGIQSTVDFVKGSIKSQLRLANKNNSRLVVIAGDDEIAKNEVSLKDMKEGDQATIKESELLKNIKKKLKG